MTSRLTVLSSVLYSVLTFNLQQRLLNIYREKVPSTRHKTFKYGSVSEKNDLKHKAGFGPVKDEETVSSSFHLSTVQRLSEKSKRTLE